MVQHAFLNEAALGMYLKQGRGHVYVEDVFPYMQAHQVGVQVGSVVLGIDRGSGWTDLSGMSCDQVIAQIDLWLNKDTQKYEKGKVYVLPKELDEKVARLHLPALGAELTLLSADQAEYISVNVEGPYKPVTYRY